MMRKYETEDILSQCNRRIHDLLQYKFLMQVNLVSILHKSLLDSVYYSSMQLPGGECCCAYA